MNDDLRHPITLALFPLITAMCRHGDVLDISEKHEGDRLMIFIRPHTADYGKVCGKGGRCIRALKFLGEFAGSMQSERVEVHLQDSYKGEREPEAVFKADQDFDIKKLVFELDVLARLVFRKKPDINAFEMNSKTMVTIKVDQIDCITSSTVVSAINDVLYPYGFNAGSMIEVKAA